MMSDQQWEEQWMKLDKDGEKVQVVWGQISGFLGRRL